MTRLPEEKRLELDKTFDRSKDLFNDVQQILQSEIRTQTRWRSVAKSLGLAAGNQPAATGCNFVVHSYSLLRRGPFIKYDRTLGGRV